MTTAEMLRSLRGAVVDSADDLIFDELADWLERDEMDAPADWDSGSITFNPYI